MFGRIRASPSSQESELQCSKLLKQDSFSVYECTLFKLKSASKQSLLEISLDNVESPSDRFPASMDIDSTPTCCINFKEDFIPGEDSPESVADSPSPVSLERPTTTNFSIPRLFSKYKASHPHFFTDVTSKPDS